MALFRKSRKSYESVILASAPIAYYPLSSKGGVDMVGGRNLTVGGSMAAGTHKLGGGVATGAVSAQAAPVSIARMATDTNTGNNAWWLALTYPITVEYWAYITKETGAVNNPVWAIGNLMLGFWQAANSDTCRFDNRDNSSSAGSRKGIVFTGGTHFAYDTWQHHAVVWESGAAAKGYVNGVLKVNTGDTVNGMNQYSQYPGLSICGWRSARTDAQTANDISGQCSVAHFAIYNKVLTTTDFLQRVALGGQ